MRAYAHATVALGINAKKLRTTKLLPNIFYNYGIFRVVSDKKVAKVVKHTPNLEKYFLEIEISNLQIYYINS